ncbi:MAG: hypothetical protein IKT40_02700 [Bacilli bacterium]|nr:hypothetical protein [Bacilli bacterium]
MAKYAYVNGDVIYNIGYTEKDSKGISGIEIGPENAPGYKLTLKQNDVLVKEICFYFDNLISDGDKFMKKDGDDKKFFSHQSEKSYWEINLENFGNKYVTNLINGKKIEVPFYYTSTNPKNTIVGGSVGSIKASEFGVPNNGETYTFSVSLINMPSKNPVKFDENEILKSYIENKAKEDLERFDLDEIYEVEVKKIEKAEEDNS